MKRIASILNSRYLAMSIVEMTIFQEIKMIHFVPVLIKRGFKYEIRNKLMELHDDTCTY